MVDDVQADEGVWACGHCGRSSSLHAKGYASEECVYAPVWRQHALTAANEIEREWLREYLAEHDRQVAEKAWDEGNACGIAFQAGGAWIDNPYWSKP